MKLRVFRYDPKEGKKFYQTYEIDYEEGMTFLRALQKIKDTLDPTLTFRHFCRAGICGTCTVMINGFPRLACKEQVLPYLLAGEEIVIEPLSGFSPIKDLAVNHDDVVNRLRRFRTWIEEVKENPQIPPSISRKIERASDCILCSACQAYCPQVKEEGYAGPLLFAKIYRFLQDPREKNKDFRIEEAVSWGHLYHCLSCDKCNSVCPKEVKPASLIRELMTYQAKDGKA